MRFINAPFDHPDRTMREQWPHATMTWGERRLFEKGELLQRDTPERTRKERFRLHRPPVL